jgi:hypothetical protein
MDEIRCQACQAVMPEGPGVARKLIESGQWIVRQVSPEDYNKVLKEPYPADFAERELYFLCSKCKQYDGKSLAFFNT